MSNGLFSGVSGLALGTGLYRDVSGLWGGASGLDAGFGFSPAVLFAQGEQGAWYDPSDLTTLFQDNLGTTPVTATGQTVGLMLDKSGRGNHATQSSLASRPILGREPFGGRRNLLTFTEQFGNAAWLKNPNITLTAGVADPNGGTNAFTVAATADSATIQQAPTVVSGVALSASIWIKRRAGTGVINLRCGDATLIPITVTATWTRVSLTATPTSTSGRFAVGISTSGDAVDIYGAQLETGSTATAYQRVTDQWNVTQAGVPSVSYLAFDGSDDFMLTGTITPGTDKVQVFAGVRKLSDAARGVLVESSVTTVLNAGTFILNAPREASATYGFGSRGDAAPVAPTAATPFASPITNILTGIGEIATNTAILRVNGTQAASTTVDQGTGNYLAYPLYIGRRGGTTLPFNGRIYSMIVRFGANLPLGTIQQTEAWVNQRTGTY
jgi:hypothetical protein